MRKLYSIFELFLLIFSVVSCAGDKESTTFQTTTETTTLETTLDTQVYGELSEKLSDFDDAFSNAAGLDIFISSSVDVYLGGDSISDLATSQAVEMTMRVDLDEPYFYSDINISDIDRFVQITELVEDKYLVYSTYYDRIQTSVVSEQELVIDETIDGAYTTGLMSGLTPDNIRYLKVSDDYYRAIVPLRQLALLNPEMFGEIEEMLGNTFDFSEIFVEIIYQFDYQGYDFYMTINMEPVAISEQGENYVGLESIQGIRVLATVDRIYFSLDSYKVEGATDLGLGIYTIRDDVDENLYLTNNSNNYFRYYFEEGYYYIDDFGVAYDEIDISLYDSEFAEVSGNRVFGIEEEGYYYVNFKNKSDSNLSITPLVYKLDEATVGLPSEPIITTNNTLTLTADMETTHYLFDDLTFGDGLFVLKNHGSGYPGFWAYYTYEQGRDYDGYYTFIIDQDNVLAMEFKNLSNVDTTYSWDFIPCGQDTTDYLEMRSYSEVSPTFIYLNEDEPNTNIAFSISETKDVTFDYEDGSFYADGINANVYTSDGTLVETNVLDATVELAAGDYYLEVTSNGYSMNPYYTYFVLIIR
jgi:hypothetical protein